jgi:hypothetical protein
MIGIENGIKESHIQFWLDIFLWAFAPSQSFK